MLADLDRAMGEAQLRRKDREAGQSNLFDLMAGEEDASVGTTNNFSAKQSLPQVPEMEELEKLKLEKELLGFFLSGHPVDTLGGLGALFDTVKQEDFDNLEGKEHSDFVVLFQKWREDTQKKTLNHGLVLQFCVRKKIIPSPCFLKRLNNTVLNWKKAQ